MRHRVLSYSIVKQRDRPNVDWRSHYVKSKFSGCAIMNDLVDLLIDPIGFNF